MRGASLRSRLFQAIGVVVIICVALTIGLGLLLTRRAVENATLKDLSHQADLIAPAVSNALKPEASLAALDKFFKTQGEQALSNPRLVLPSQAQTLLTQKQGADGTVSYQGRDYYFAARPYTTDPGFFILLKPQSAATSLLSTYVFGLLIAAGAGGLLAAIAAFLVARRISRPVDRIAIAARTLTSGTHPEPVPVEGAAEIASLAISFNALVAQLQQAQEAERNFLLSVSHELKTPLTAIRGYSEAVEDGAIDPREAAATVTAEARRLERLVKDLLDLARMNRTDFSVHNADIDLSEVVEDVCRRYQQAAADFGVTLRARTDGPAPGVADADRVLQVISNLVENALRLTPAGGEVRVIAEPGMLRVEDTGPGLEAGDTEHAFERFYLHERYGRERPVGTGLGLAIVKELTHAMGGTVDVESRAGELTVFTVRLQVPRAAREELPA
jgi:two-component system sensor histidine kinase BaeS